jgi:hypothetical protein
MNVYIQRDIKENWVVWEGDEPDVDKAYPDTVVHFIIPEMWYLDAYSYSKTLSERLGVGLREVPQPR